MCYDFVFFFKQKTAYEIVSGDWSSDVCSSDLERRRRRAARLEAHPEADERAAHERAPVARQDLPRLEHDAEVHAGGGAAEGQALLNREEDLADAEEADHRDDEIEALHQIGDPEGHPQLTGDDVEAHGRQDESEQDRHERLERVTTAETDEARKGQ